MRIRVLTFLGLIALLGWPLARVRGDPPATRPEEPPLVRALDDDDPAVREQAQQQLVADPSMHSVVVYFMDHAPQPEVRRRCAEIALRYPWAHLTNGEARALLANYGGDVSSRRQLITRLGQMPHAGGFSTLSQLLEQEPSLDLRWQIMSILANSQGAQADRIRALRPEDDPDASAPLLATVACAALDADPERALMLYHRALDAEEQNPTGNNIVVVGRFRQFVYFEIGRGHYTQAAGMLRQVSRLTWCPLGNTGAATAEVQQFAAAPEAVELLFALHAEHGPLPGFADDLRQYAPFLRTPGLAYDLSIILRRGGNPVQAAACAVYARACAGTNADTASRLGFSLLIHQHLTQAETEFRDAIALNGSNGTIPVLHAYDGLAKVAEAAHNYDAAADALDAGERYVATIPNAVESSPELARQTIAWYRLLGARQRHDEKAVDAQVAQLTDSPLLDIDRAIELYHILMEMHRPQDAQKYFDAIYTRHEDALKTTPDNASVANNLAWLCAQCGQHSDEAITLAETAMKTMPGNPGYMDTAAAAYFAAGKKEQAIALEKRAIELRPDDPSMRKQLERFEAP